jgi:cold shock CspA family protein
MRESEKRTGYVKAFNGVYGFIVPDDGGHDVYFSSRTARYFDLPMLLQGDAVVFTSVDRTADKSEAVRIGIALSEGAGS